VVARQGDSGRNIARVNTEGQAVLRRAWGPRGTRSHFWRSAARVYRTSPCGAAGLGRAYGGAWDQWQRGEPGEGQASRRKRRRGERK